MNITQNEDRHWKFGESVNRLIFTKNDFPFRCDMRNSTAASYANCKLERYLELCPTVYGNPEAQWWQSFQGDALHTAKIICIEKLVKECQQHEPGVNDITSVFNQKCMHCGVAITVEWKAK